MSWVKWRTSCFSGASVNCSSMNLENIMVSVSLHRKLFAFLAPLCARKPFTLKISFNVSVAVLPRGGI